MSVLQAAVIRYRNALITPAISVTSSANPALIAAFLRNVESLGFAPSNELLNRICHIKNDAQFKLWAVDVLTILRELKGDNYVYTPMYPNFPQQVADASELELFLNAITHYFGDWAGVRILPDYEKEERFPLYEDTKLTVLGWAKNITTPAMIASLLEAKISFSEKDIELLTGLIKSIVADDADAVVQAVPEFIPTVIPNKENLASLAKIVRGNSVLKAEVFQRATTATDLLRIAAVYSDSHPSLGEKFRFGKFSRSERRTFITRLTEIGNLVEDFKRNREMWKRFGEKLHPTEFVTNDSHVAEAFIAIRSGRNISTWGTTVEEAFSSNETVAAVTALSKRPGEFARRLNQLLDGASTDETEYVLREFAATAEKVSTTVLWQVVSFFRTLKENPDRGYSTIFPKGVSATAFALPRTKTNITATVIEEVLTIAITALTVNYAQRDSLGKVFFDTDGYNPAIPFGMRNSNTAFRVVGRGTRTKFDVEKTLRFFIHWQDQNTDDSYDSRVDLDLSAVALDENFNKVSEITYYNLQGYGGVHSGDITSAPYGASEFIDIPVKRYRKAANARYVAMTVHSYTHQKFSDLTEVLAGFMVREDAQSGEIYDPKTVENAFKVNSNSTSVIPLVFDMLTGEAIWIDIPLAGAYWENNVANTAGTISSAVQGLVNKKFVGAEDVLALNIQTRGTLVDTADEAGTIISLKNGEMSVGFDELIGKWL